jgi:hypothetical protein
MTALHPLHPPEIEAALGDRGPYRARDVWASLRPVEAEPGPASAGRTPWRKGDTELSQEAGPRPCDLRRFVVEHDVVAGDQCIGERDAETACQVVVADPGRAEGLGLAGERAVARSLLEGHGGDPLDHLGNGR